MRFDGILTLKGVVMAKKTPFGVTKAKSAKSPTGKPSKKSSAAKKMDKGDFSGGSKPIRKKTKKKKGFQKGTIPRVEEVLRRSGA